MASDPNLLFPHNPHANARECLRGLAAPRFLFTAINISAKAGFASMLEG